MQNQIRKVNRFVNVLRCDVCMFVILQLQLLMQEAVSLVTKPNFTTILCYAFERQEAKVRLCTFAQLLISVYILCIVYCKLSIVTTAS